MRTRPRTVVIALGTALRGDDGLGPAVADALSGRLGGAAILRGRDDPLALLAAWEGAGLAVIVDAAAPGPAPGTIRRIEGCGAPVVPDLSACSSHGLGLAEAMALGKVLGRLPRRLVIYAVEARSFETGAPLSAEVAAAVPEVAHRIAAELAALPGPEAVPHA